MKWRRCTGAQYQIELWQYSAGASRSAGDDDDGISAAANKDPGQWMSHGRDWTEQRFSPLKQINDANVSRLGLRGLRN